MAHPEFTLLGDAVWLDFVNSARGRTTSPPDLLPDASAFTRWAHAQRLIDLNGGAPHTAVLELRQQLTRVSGEWRLQFAPAQPLAPLEAIARSAALTLADPKTTVRRCTGETCSLFFADSSPNRSRLWCATTCANQRIDRRRGVRR
jgi:predicted RNA-binding Zn ribbon-like protein